jgi:hypothetical protein
MLRFIVPLQSPKASDKWKRVSELCNQTLASVTNQTGKAFEVLLVCNEPPDNYTELPSVTVYKCGLPVPEPNYDARMADKWKKVRAGLAYFRGKGEAFYMVVDADDRINRHLADFVERENYKPGWYCDKGWVYDWGYSWMYSKSKRFDLYCGTSSIVYCTQDQLPAGMDDPATHCPIVRYGHTRIKEFYDGQPNPLKPLPFYGAIYIASTGENQSGFSYLRIQSRREQLKRLLSIRPITNRKRRDFALWDK